MAETTSYVLLQPADQKLCDGIVKKNETGELLRTDTRIACPSTVLASLFPSSTAAASASTAQPASTNTGNTDGASGPAVPSQTSTSNSPPGGISNSTAPKLQKTPTGKGLAGGAVAGVAIGMLLAGALIVGLIFYFLLRRQKKRHAMSSAAYLRQHPPYTERNVGPEKGVTVVAATVGSIDDLLPQPVEDDAITGELSKIRDNIKNHVRTYYHSGPVSSADINEAGIRDTATLTESSAAVLFKTLSDPSTRDTALRSIVASVILTRCTGERSPSLLPSELAALSTSIPLNNANNSQSVLFSKWKAITGALLQQRFGKQSQDPGRARSFQDTVTSLDAILAPFVKGSVDSGKRRQNLDMILTRAANFAFLLFAQPGSFRFDFASSNGGLTVFPALVQTVGDQGQPLSPVKVLAKKEVTAP